MRYSGRELVYLNHYAHYDCRANDYAATRDGAHAGIELYYRCEGPLTVIPYHGAAAKTLRSAEGFAFNATYGHREIFAGGRLDYRVINFLPGLISELSETLGVQLGELLLEPVPFALSPAECATLDLLGGVVDPLLVESISLSFLASVLLRGQRTVQPRLKALTKRAHFPDSVQRARYILHDHLFDSELSLRELSARSHMSRFHLIRSFKTRVGSSPFAYRQALRMEHARRRLRTGAKPSTVRTELDIESASNFSRIYRAYHGVNPSRELDAPAVSLPTQFREKQFAAKVE